MTMTLTTFLILRKAEHEHVRMIVDLLLAFKKYVFYLLFSSFLFVLIFVNFDIFATFCLLFRLYSYLLSILFFFVIF